MSSSPEPQSAQTSKRKRDIIPEDDDDKLEIDVNLPEPPSKKAKRKEKKLSKKRPESAVNGNDSQKGGAVVDKDTPSASADAVKPDAETSATAKRSQYGIWIGNLPFKVTKDMLRRFLLDQGGIDDDQITRTHMPTGEKGQNKGFAYVDFSSQAMLEIALALSEKLIAGRRCLIKNANSFEGRPAKTENEADRAKGFVSKKEPSKRVFVGNMSFDLTKEELADHFSQAGQVDDIFLATFEDSGKCKGFGWVTFADLEAAEKAVRGFIYKDTNTDGSDGEDDDDAETEEDKPKPKSAKAKKPRKWFINKIHGRLLRCEFAEDAQTRYTKRFGKGASKPSSASPSHEAAPGTEGDNGDAARETSEARNSTRSSKGPKPKRDKEERREDRRKRHDARTVAPGKALANAQRATGAIVAGTGSKVTFD